MSSNFNPQINSILSNQPTGYGQIFCNYPRRRADYAINDGIADYQFSFLKNDHEPQSLNPRSEVRNNGNMNSYDKGAPIQHLSNYSNPYPKEKNVQDRTIPLNNDIHGPSLRMAPQGPRTLPIRTTFQGPGLPKVTIPNPRVPVYNHIIPYQMVTDFGKCPCDQSSHKTEHVWSNGTRVKGFDPRLVQMNNRRYQSAIKHSQSFPRQNMKTCFKTGHIHCDKCDKCKTCKHCSGNHP